MSHLFIHIPKTGGMSIRHGLRGQITVAGQGMHKSPAYTKALLEHMRMRGEHHGFEHARWRDIREDLREMPTFACVRNPWARTASRYFFGLLVARQRKPESKNYDANQTFEQFLDERLRWGHEPFYWHRGVRGWYPQTDYVTDEDGKIRCTILRTERLNQDLKKYLGAELPPRRRNVTTNTQPYQDIYTTETIQIVADWYAKDIETFGFDFDSPARKHVLMR